MQLGTPGSTNVNLLHSDRFTYRNQDFTVDKGGSFTNGQKILASVGELTQMQLWNPNASGITVLLDGIVITVSSTGIVVWGNIGAAFTNKTATSYNDKFGDPVGAAEIRHQWSGGRQTTAHSFYQLTANIPFVRRFEYPMLIGANKGFGVEGVSLNIDLAVEFKWREV